MENIQIICENNHAVLWVRVGTTLSQILEIVSLPTDQNYVAAYVDNHIKELTYPIYTSRSIRFIALTSSDGMRIYSRSLFFLLQKAVRDLHPEGRLRMRHPVGRGFYAEIEGIGALTANQTSAIEARMRQLISQDIPIIRQKMLLEDARALYLKEGWSDKIKLLDTRPHFFVSIFNLAGLNGYFYGTLVHSTAALTVFGLEAFGDGLVVLAPQKENPTEVEKMCLQAKLFDVFKQNKEWSEILGVANVGDLNQKIIDGQGGELIKIGEALQEKNFAHVADIIHSKHRDHGVRIVLIAGPSSSGKTTFSKRLAIQLRVLGLMPKTISLDNYFVDRLATPLDENGNYDFECLEALDVETFNRDLLSLFNGQQVELCKFDFHTGTRYLDGETMQLDDRSVLVIEGIHALNPQLTHEVDDALKFKIYASALTTLAIDNMTVVHTTDNRLLRRMVRDSKYRSRTALETLRTWPSVRRGEDLHIFPYQEQADIMFGTSLFFEISILAEYAAPLLYNVPNTAPEAAEAIRLLKFLNCFTPMPHSELPPTSILREFIGGSSFTY